MSSTDHNIDPGGFAAHLPPAFEIPFDEVGRLLLREYGSIFVAQGVVVPKVVIFKNTASVNDFQASVGTVTDTVGGIKVELQAVAMHELQSARRDAERSDHTITPRGTDAARRSYDDTVTLWASRVEPALEHWLAAGRISVGDAVRIRSLSPFEQVSEIFKLEDEGIFFSKDLSKPIIYSVAPPGASQHLSMLALDVSEYDDPNVREILARHGWFQTVVSDLPHFTYLGVSEGELPMLGLREVKSGDRVFWVPDL